MPWSIILPILTSVVGGLATSSQSSQKSKDVGAMAPYLNQFWMPGKSQLGGMNNVLTQAIMNNLGRYSDWGWGGTNSGDLRGLIGQYLSSGGAGNVITGR